MNTSYFSKSSKHPNAISIARKNPSWYTGKTYLKLAPSFQLLTKYYKDRDSDYYTKIFKSEVLAKLDPQTVFNDLGDNAVLLCYESPEKFCHRHLVAEWLSENLRCEIIELI
jgi:hypothetical protein